MLRVSIIPFFAEGRSSFDGADTQSQAMSDRDYLNGLVETSVSSTDNQARIRLENYNSKSRTSAYV